MRLRLFLVVLILSAFFVMPAAGYTNGILSSPLSEITLIPEELQQFIAESPILQYFLSDDPIYVLEFPEIGFSIPSDVKPTIKIIVVIIGIIIMLLGLFTSDRISQFHFRRKLSDNPKSRAMQILAYLRKHPGATQTEIVKATGYSRGSVAYNLQRLQQDCRVSQITSRYYPADEYPTEEQAGADRALRNAQRQRIFRIIAENPGISRKQLAEEIQMPVSTLRWHLGKLTKEHLVISEVKQHTICYSVNPDFIPQDE